MKNIAKKSISTVIAVCIVISMVCSIGIIEFTASAGEQPEYYEFVNTPGFSVWTDDELKLIESPMTDDPVHSTENMPAGVDDVVKFHANSVNMYNGINISSGHIRNWNTASNSGLGIEWGAMSLINGKTIIGDADLSQCDGLCFWIGQGKGVFTGEVKIQLFLAECKGPYYKGCDDGETDLDNAPVGYRYESTTARADSDGYVYFDYDKDFRQVDWWSTDDNGVSQSVYDIGENFTPLPEKVKESFNGIEFIVLKISAGTDIYIGDIKGYTDTRIFTDVLDDALDCFGMIDSSAYTEASYAAATDVYLYAFDIAQDIPAEFTQKDVDSVAKRLNDAIAALDPLFPVESETKVSGFEVWDDDDLSEMADGGVCIDVAYTEEDENGSKVSIVSVASVGNPDYGWSRFISAVEGEEGYEAVKNPFGTELSSTDGMAFTLEYANGYQPSDIILGVGASNGAFFEAFTPDVIFPASGESGLVYVSWSKFTSEDGESDIFDYLDSLDYFELRLAESSQEGFAIRDLYVFNWAINDADFTSCDEAIADAEKFIGSASESSYTPDSWERFIAAYENAKELHDVYGATDKDAMDAVTALKSAQKLLVAIGSGASYETLKKLYADYNLAKAFWSGNYSLTTAKKVTSAIANYEAVMYTVISEAKALELDAALVTAISGLKKITEKSLNENVYSFEDYTLQDLDFCGAKRSDGVFYSLAENSDGVQSLAMTSVRNINSSEESAMSFYTYYNDQFERALRHGTTCSGLNGINGFIFEVEVNDLSLIDNGTLSFGLMNTSGEKPFNRRADGIALPASGKGKIYVPTTSLTTNVEYGNPLSVANIAGYYFTVNGEIKEGFEIKITNLVGYVGMTNSTPEAPVINGLTDGATYNAGIIPAWNNGAALLDGEYYVNGTPITVNGEHELTVYTGPETASVKFSIVGGTDPDSGKKGDIDDDGEITVTDALAVLRMAAKLSVPTSKEFKLADVDGDGEITVTDALAVLRVAAKLADSL